MEQSQEQVAVQQNSATNCVERCSCWVWITCHCLSKESHGGRCVVYVGLPVLQTADVYRGRRCRFYVRTSLLHPLKAAD